MTVLLAFAGSLVLPLLLSVRVEAQTVPAQSDCGSKAYLDNLPVPPPKDPNVKRQVQLVNCTDQVILGAANAAHEANHPPYPVFPQDGTWVMQPYPSGSNANVLTIDIPPQWYGQFKSGGVAPNFWARTGCRYDPVANRAQCETGGCGGQYDCSSADISPPPATTLIEWTFYQNFDGVHIDSPDISAVNGANLTVDVAPRGSSDRNPLNSKDFHWLAWNYPLTVHGADLREPAKCNSTTGNFTVKRSDIDQTQNPHLQNYPLLGYVIVDSNGIPTMPTGDNTLACLSNCGRYKFPLEVGSRSCNAKLDQNCYFWDTFCAGNEDIKYGQECDSDADCLRFNGGVNFHIACFKKSGPDKKGKCELRAFYKGTVSQCNGLPDPQPTGPASSVACNNTYGSINPLDNDPQTNHDWADQPIVGNCSDVAFLGHQAACIGDDTVHQVLHGAYTWPNDPEVFGGDAPVYRIVFAPGGTGNAPVTAAQTGILQCSSLPDNYKYSDNRTNCGIPVNNQNAVFGIGVIQNAGSDKWQSSGHDWPCNLDQRGAGDNGVVCRWNPAPVSNCSAPVTDGTYVTNSACGRIDAGTLLVSGSITPNSGDPLFLEVSVPKVLNNVSLPASVSGCVPASGMGAWSLVASKAIHSSDGIIAWYKGTANTSVACNVTVTMASENPAELKIYDVPKFNGTVETMSSASGEFAGGPFPSVSAGRATTAFSNDLQLGALLMVDQHPTPITYWTNWLSNGPNQLDCLNNNVNCPKDDGPDYLPGHGPFSGNSDVGHRAVTAGTQYFHRDGFSIGRYAWGGLAIYVELNP